MNNIFDFFSRYVECVPCDSSGVSPIEYIPMDKELNWDNSHDMTFFKSEEEMIDYISSRIAEYIFDKSNSKTFGFDSSPLEPLMQETHFFPFNHVSLSQIGISEFALYGEQQILLVYLRLIPDFQKFVIENYIWNLCAERTANKLSKLTMFKVKLQHIDGVPSPVLSSNCEFGLINTIAQLKVFVENEYRDSLFLMSKSFNPTIHIDADKVQIPLENIPRHVKLSVVLTKPEDEQDWPDGIAYEPFLEELNYQIVLNANSSIILVAHPMELKQLFDKMFDEWGEYISYFNYYDYIFVPEELSYVVGFYSQNNLTSPFGKITKVYDKDQSFKIAKARDEEKFSIEERNHCFTFLDKVLSGYILVKLD